MATVFSPLHVDGERTLACPSLCPSQRQRIRCTFIRGGVVFKKFCLSCFSLAIAVGALAPSADAQGTYPSKPIKIIAPVQPGGGVDLVARQIGERLTRALGQPVVVDNQSGGGGIVGSQATARAAPDGYTLMVGYVGTHGTNPAVRKLPYDAVKDFTPIAMVGGTPNLLVVISAVPANDLKSFIDYAKKNPTKLNYGTGGIGLLNHLALEQFRAAAGLPDAVYAHYRGIGPAIQDMLGNQIQVLMPGLAAALPPIPGGKLQPLGLPRPPSPGCSAIRWCPTCRRSRNRASRGSTACSGTASSARRSCRPRSRGS